MNKKIDCSVSENKAYYWKNGRYISVYDFRMQMIKQFRLVLTIAILSLFINLILIALVTLKVVK